MLVSCLLRARSVCRLVIRSSATFLPTINCATSARRASSSFSTLAACPSAPEFALASRNLLFSALKDSNSAVSRFTSAATTRPVRLTALSCLGTYRTRRGRSSCGAVSSPPGLTASASASASSSSSLAFSFCTSSPLSAGTGPCTSVPSCLMFSSLFSLKPRLRPSLLSPENSPLSVARSRKLLFPRGGLRRRSRVAGSLPGATASGSPSNGPDAISSSALKASSAFCRLSFPNDSALHSLLRLRCGAEWCTGPRGAA
mmetsp:Transcript_1796/g.3989  ORF Transcript_1796/g.3989 Transcript_1796/m.3989 type:complete len:258 (+) Transcript_1796:1622-2395(+)